MQLCPILKRFSFGVWHIWVSALVLFVAGVISGEWDSLLALPPALEPGRTARKLEQSKEAYKQHTAQYLTLGTIPWLFCFPEKLGLDSGFYSQPGGLGGGFCTLVGFPPAGGVPSVLAVGLVPLAGGSWEGGEVVTSLPRMLG